MILNLSLIGGNALLMGLLAAGFATGPYSSFEQEFWYRYISLGFVVVAVLLPFLVMALRLYRLPGVKLAINCWSIFCFFAFIPYVMLSGGGV